MRAGPIALAALVLLGGGVAGCTGGDEMAAADGELDCAGNEQSSRTSIRDSGAGTHDTPEEAINAELGWLLGRFSDGVTIDIRGTGGSIIVEAREVAVTTALEGDDGRWFTSEVTWCVE